MKLRWINGQYIRKLKVTELYDILIEHYTYTKDEQVLIWLSNKDYSLKILPLVQERLSILSDYKELVKYFYTVDVIPSNEGIQEYKDLLISSGKDKAQVMLLLSFVYKEIEEIEKWTLANLHAVEVKIRDLATQNNWKTLNAFMPIRVAVTGTKQSPPLFDVIEVLGKEKTLDRLNQVIQGF